MMKTKNQLSEVLRAMNFPKQGDILSETQVLASTANMEDGILKYEVDFPKGTKTKQIPTLLKKFFSTQIVPTEDNLVVRYHDYTVKPKAGNVTVVGAMHILPVVRANPSLQEFDQDYSKMEMENPHTYFRHHDCGEQNSPQFRAKMFTLVSHMGENYGYGLGKDLYHRRASLIMPKIKITKAVPEATMMYHTHPRRDEPSLSSPDDYLLYMDLSHKPRSIRHFYTVMADRLDHFQIKPKKDSKGNYVKLDEDKILKELNDEMDDIEAMWEKKTPKTGDYQDDLRFCENITRDFVKWLNKRYSQYFTFTYKCHYKVKKNPPEPEIDDLHLNDEILGKSLDAIKNRDYSWDAPVKEKAHETYAYWHQIRREDTLQGSASTLGITPQGSHKRTYERYMKKIFEESQYTYFDALNILNLAHDISMIDSKIRDGGGLSSRMAEICDYLEMPEEATETLLFLEEVIHNEDIFTAEAETMTGDFYGLALIASYTIQAIGAIDLVKKGEKNFESVQYNIYSRLKTETQEKFQTFLVGELDHRGKAYGENAPIAQGFVDSFLNPPQVLLKKTDFEHIFPKEAFAYDAELVKEALDEFNVEKYEPNKTFQTGTNALNLRFPVTSGKVSMIIQPRTGNAQIFVTGRPNAMEDALDAVTKVGTALVRYGLPGIDPETYDVQAIDIAQNPQTSQVIAIAGPSGSGKSTTIRGLLKLLPNSKTVPTLTTRQQRKSDKPGERIFVSVEQFKKEMNDGELVAAEMQKNGNYYGRRKSDFENAGYVIIDVNPRGVNAIKRAYPNTFTAYLEPVEDPEFIRKRLLRRGDMSPQEAKARAAIIPSHIKSSKQIDFDARVKTKQGEFAKIALELEPLIPKQNPSMGDLVAKIYNREEEEEREGLRIGSTGSRSSNSGTEIHGDVIYAIDSTINTGDGDQSTKQNPNLGEMVRKIFRRKREVDDPEVLPETPPRTWEEIEASLPADDMDQEEVNKMYAKFGIGPTPVETSGDQSTEMTASATFAAEMRAEMEVEMERREEEISEMRADMQAMQPDEVRLAEIRAELNIHKRNPSKKPKAVRIEESPNKEKKLVAYFYDKDGKKFRTVHFGARGMSDYTQHKDPDRMKNYLARHGGMGEDWKDPMTAGALSRWILWGKPSLRESFNDFKKRFKLKGVMAVTNTKMNPHHCPIEVEARRAASDKGFKHHKWYIEHHLDYVMAIAKAIVNSDEPEDQQLIHDMVWMHDYPKMMGDNDNFELVRELVSKHRDERYTDRLMNQLRWMEEIKSPDWSGRTTTIAAVMSTADALAHYYGPFWQIYLDENPDTPIAELKKSNAEKLEKDKRKLRAGPMKDGLEGVKFQYKGRKVRVVGNEHIAELIARKNPKAPGYNSYAWTTQDWRSIKVNNKGDIDYSEKCGAEGTKTPSGSPRLCLPAEVVRSLMRTDSGKDVIRTQARKKARAEKGERVPWHPRIKKIWKRVEDQTPKDNPSLTYDLMSVVSDRHLRRVNEILFPEKMKRWKNSSDAGKKNLISKAKQFRADMKYSYGWTGRTAKTAIEAMLTDYANTFNKNGYAKVYRGLITLPTENLSAVWDKYGTGRHWSSYKEGADDYVSTPIHDTPGAVLVLVEGKVHINEVAPPEQQLSARIDYPLEKEIKVNNKVEVIRYSLWSIDPTDRVKKPKWTTTGKDWKPWLRRGVKPLKVVEVNETFSAETPQSQGTWNNPNQDYYAIVDGEPVYLVKENAPSFISARDPQKWSDRYDKIIKMSGDQLMELAEKQAAEKGLRLELVVKNREYKENSRQLKLPPKQQKMYKEYIESLERVTITLSRGNKLIDTLRFTILTQSPTELIEYLTNRKVWRKESNNKSLDQIGRVRTEWDEDGKRDRSFRVQEIPMTATLQNKNRFPFAVAGGGGYQMSEGQTGKGYYGIIKTYQAGFLEANNMEQYGMGVSPMRADLYQSYGWLTSFSYKDNYPYPSRAAEYYLDLHSKSKEATKDARYYNIYRPVYSSRSNPPEWRHGEFAEEDPFEEYFSEDE